MEKPSRLTMALALLIVAALALVGAWMLSSDQDSREGATISGTVTEVGGGMDTLGGEEPATGAEVTLSRPGENTSFLNTTTAWDGTYSFDEVPNGTYLLGADYGQYREDRTVTVTGTESLTEDFTFGGETPATGGATPAVSVSPPFPLIFMVLASAAFLGALLYARIHRNQLLQNVVRQRITHHIEENPGTHYRAILTDLDLPMGVLTYHLNTLEKAGLVKSRQDGVYRRFYPPGVRTDVTIFLSEIQQRIVSVIQKNAGISQAHIAEELDVSRPLVNYHIRILKDAGLVRVEPQGRATACFMTESGA